MVDLLFRKEAVDARSLHLLGDAEMGQPLSLKVWVLIIFCVFFIFVYFLCIATYSRKEIFAGYLVSQAGQVNVHIEDVGTIAEVYVTEDQIVQKGQKLFSLETDNSLESRSDVNKFIIRSSELQIENLSNRSDLLKELVSQKTAYHENSAETISDKIILESRRHKLYSERLKHAEVKLAKLEKLLEKRLVSEDSIIEARDKVLFERLASEQISISILDLEKSLRDRKYQTKIDHIEDIEKLGDLELQIQQLEQQIFLQRKQISSIITAPTYGKVTSLQAKVGVSISSQQLALSIIPEESDLEAEIFIPIRSIGFVQIGNRVHLRYDSFPHEIYGSYPGSITSISKTVLTPSQITGPFIIQEPMYKATLRLDKNMVYLNNKEFSLQQDMTFQADMAIDNRPLYQWIFRPIVDVIKRL